MTPFNFRNGRPVELDMRGARLTISTPKGQALIEVNPNANATLTIGNSSALSIDDTAFTFIIPDKF